jgi:hypothetical protein
MEPPYNIEEARKHVVIDGKCAVHIFPITVIERLISGSLDITEIDHYSDIIPEVFSIFLDAISCD